jgi:dTDP-4-dehydrorhamnose 3,5-epimerase
MKRIRTKMNDVFIIEPAVFEDKRGFFMESYSCMKFVELGIDCSFVQDNHSLSVESSVLRGLHYQLAPKAQTKLVRVIVGSVYDVVVDIRRSSPTFGQWMGVILSAANKKQLLVPQGFAHGFITLEPNTEVLYKVDEYYSSEHDRGIAWNDPSLAIDWGITSVPILSDKDAKLPLLKDAEMNFE